MMVQSSLPLLTGLAAVRAGSGVTGSGGRVLPLPAARGRPERLSGRGRSGEQGAFPSAPLVSCKPMLLCPSALAGPCLPGDV